MKKYYNYNNQTSVLLSANIKNKTYICIDESNNKRFVSSFEISQIVDMKDFLSNLNKIVNLNSNLNTKFSSIEKDDEFIYLISTPITSISIKQFIATNINISGDYIVNLFTVFIEEVKQALKMGLSYDNITLDNIYISNNKLFLLDFGSCVVKNEEDVVRDILILKNNCINMILSKSTNNNNNFNAPKKTGFKSWQKFLIIGIASVVTLASLVIGMFSLINAIQSFDSVNNYLTQTEASGETPIQDENFDENDPNDYAPSELTWYYDYNDNFDHEVIFDDMVTEYNGWVYYRRLDNSKPSLYKRQVTTAEEILLIENLYASSLAVNDTHIYYIDCNDYYSLYRCTLEGKDVVKLTDYGVFDLTFNADKTVLYFIELAYGLGVEYYDVETNQVVTLSAVDIGEIEFGNDMLYCFGLYENTIDTYKDETFVESIHTAAFMQNPKIVGDEIYYIDYKNYTFNMINIKENLTENIIHTDVYQFDIIGNTLFYNSSDDNYGIIIKNFETDESIIVGDNIDYFKIIGDKIYLSITTYDEATETYSTKFGFCDFDGNNYFIIDTDSTSVPIILDTHSL